MWNLVQNRSILLMLFPGAQEELTPGPVHDCRAVSFSELRKESWNPVLSCCLPFFLPTSGSLCFSHIMWATEYKRLEVGWKGQKCFFLYWVNSYLGLVSLVTWLVTVLRSPPTFRSTLWVLPPSGCYYWYFQEHLWKVWQEGTALSGYPEIRRVRIFKKHTSLLPAILEFMKLGISFISLLL